jgi:hypothetical protein
LIVRSVARDKVFASGDGGRSTGRPARSDRQSMTPVSRSSRIVTTAEIIKDPMQPLRFEKKRNMSGEAYPAAPPSSSAVIGR